VLLGEQAVHEGGFPGTEKAGENCDRGEFGHGMKLSLAIIADVRLLLQNYCKSTNNLFVILSFLLRLF
jgi:hypothetical protein